MVKKGHFCQLSQTSGIKVVLELLRPKVEEHEEKEGKPEALFYVFELSR